MHPSPSCLMGLQESNRLRDTASVFFNAERKPTIITLDTVDSAPQLRVESLHAFHDLCGFEIPKTLRQVLVPEPGYTAISLEIMEHLDDPRHALTW